MPSEDIKYKIDIVDRAQLIMGLLAALNMPVDFTTVAALRLVAFQINLGREEFADFRAGDITVNELQAKVDKVAVDIKNKSIQELDFILADKR